MNIPTPCQPGDPCYGKYLIAPGGPVYTKSDDVIYIGTNLPNTGIKTGDCLTLALKKIDHSLIDFVKNEGGTPSIITSNGFPLFGTVGRLLVNTADNYLYEDTGTAWQLIGSAPGNYLTLGTGQVVQASTTSIADTTIKLTINGVDYYLLATTIAP